MREPLDDPAYVPLNPPVNGHPTDVVAKWGARSQLRWFARFQNQLKPWPHAEWGRFYCESESHRGQCCSSCIDDKANGYGDDIDECCCEALRARDDQS
jgi:hypothetical protein